jgi:hypothetical protein
MAVAPGGFGLGRVAGHCRGARRYDHGRFRVTLGDAVINAGLVVRAVTGERGHGSLDLVEQEIDLGAVIGVMAGQRRDHNPARVGVHAEMELSP